MAFNSAIVRVNLPDVASNTVDATSSGFGTPAAAILITCSANTTNNPEADSQMAISFWDGTNTRSCSSWSQDNVGTTNTDRRHSGSNHQVYENGGSSTWSISNITDGIRLTMVTDNTTVSKHCTVILLSGISAKVLSITGNATVDTATESASLGFEPELLLLVTCGLTGDTASAAGATLSFGLCGKDLTQRSFSYMNRNGRSGSSQMAGYFSESYAIAEVFTTLVWAGEITAMGTDTFTMTSRAAGANGNVIFVLALGGADIAYDFGTLTTPTSTGNSTISTSITPELLLIQSTFMDSIDTLDTVGDEMESWCTGMSDGTNDYLHQMTGGDGISTTNEQSLTSTAAIIDVDRENAGFNNAIDATVDSFNSSNFILNYSAVDASSRYGWWLALGSTPAASSKTIYHHFKQMGVY